MSNVWFRLVVRVGVTGIGTGVPYEQVCCNADNDESLDEEND
jgi:hypothetical protein